MTSTRPILLKLTALVLLLLIQGPAMLMQEVAWVKMLVTYTQERGLKRGIIETFDGQHPCEMCMKAAKLRGQEESQDPADKQMLTQRPRLAWAEMVFSEALKLPAPTGYDISLPMLAHAALCSGIGAFAPDSPPPESA